ncbi:MAG: hypothetical protein AABX29_06830 [Nanoarchaeota archaeon]
MEEEHNRYCRILRNVEKARLPSLPINQAEDTYLCGITGSACVGRRLSEVNWHGKPLTTEDRAVFYKPEIDLESVIVKCPVNSNFQRLLSMVSDGDLSKLYNHF